MEPAVKSITVKGIPETVLKKLKKRAEANRRSLNSEILVQLERVADETSPDRARLLAEIDAARSALPRLGLTSTEIRRAVRSGRE